MPGDEGPDRHLFTQIFQQGELVNSSSIIFFYALLRSDVYLLTYLRSIDRRCPIYVAIVIYLQQCCTIINADNTCVGKHIHRGGSARFGFGTGQHNPDGGGITAKQHFCCLGSFAKPIAIIQSDG